MAYGDHSGYPRYDQGHGHGHHRSNHRQSTPPADYHGDWDGYWRQKHNNSRRRDLENDSGYGSNRTSEDMNYWKTKAEDYKEQIEASNKNLKEVSGELDDEKTRNKGLKKSLKDERQNLARERGKVNRLRAALGTEFIRNKSWDQAISVYGPLVASLERSLHDLENDCQAKPQEIENARQHLLDTEFKYAQALAGADRDTDAEPLLSRVFDARQRGDKFCLSDSTREAHRALSSLLARSKSEDDWVWAQKMFMDILVDRKLDSKAAERPWVLYNLIQRARLLIRQKQLMEVTREVKRMSQLYDYVSPEQQASVNTCISELVHELHTLGRHDIASKVTIATIGPDTLLSDAALRSFAALEYGGLMQVWDKCCSVLKTTEQRHAGWQLSSHLISAKRYVEAERILRLLPAASDSSSSPSDDQVNDLRSHVLLELAVDVDGYRKAAQIAIKLFKRHGFRAVSQNTERHHVATVLGAVDGISKLAGRLSDPPPAFKEANTEFWLPIFDKATKYTNEVDKSILTSVAETGRNLYSRWRDNAKARSKNPSKLNPSGMMRELAANVATAEAWFAKSK